MKRILSFVSALVMILGVLLGTAGTAGAAGEPELFTNKYTVAPGERFALSWNEPSYDGQMSLWKKRLDTNSAYEFVANVPNRSAGYGVTLDRAGKWGFCLFGSRNGRNAQSWDLAIDVVSGGGRKPNAQEAPQIYCNKPAVEAGERFALSWYADKAEGSVNLWKRWENSSYEYVATLPKNTDGYELSLERKGTWHFALMTKINGKDVQSEEYCVLVGASREDAEIRRMEARGMDNFWNVLFVIYENVNIDGFRNSFSTKDIARIEDYAKYLSYTVYGITGGRMEIGTVETIRISEPITSASYRDQEKAGLRALTFGPGKDVNLNGLLETRDVNLVVVYAPLSGLSGTWGWAGLSPFTVGEGASQCSALLVNMLHEEETFYETDGFIYMEGIHAILHEMLHCVEVNSRANGWSGFEELHSLWQNGYDDSHMEYQWFRDLTRDRLKSGRKGFRRISFYVKHKYK